MCSLNNMKTLIMVQKHNNNAFDKFLFLAMKAFILARALFPKESYLGGIRNAIQSNTFFFSDIQEDSHKVNKCLARYSPRATTISQPTTRTPNEPAMNKNANFGPNLAILKMCKNGNIWPKIGIFVHCWLI